MDRTDEDRAAPKPATVRLHCDDCGDLGEDVPNGDGFIADVMNEHWQERHQPFIRIVR